MCRHVSLPLLLALLLVSGLALRARGAGVLTQQAAVPQGVSKPLLFAAGRSL